jgi:hypothetical protein
MADRVQDRFTHSPLGERRNRVDKQPVLEVLLVVPQIDPIPEFVVEREDAAAEGDAVLSRPGGFRRAILEDYLGGS